MTCPECGRFKANRIALGLHRRRTHGVRGECATIRARRFRQRARQKNSLVGERSTTWISPPREHVQSLGSGWCMTRPLHPQPARE